MPEPTLLIVTDPERFATLVAEEDAARRLAGFQHLEDAVLCEIIRFDRRNTAAPLAWLYGEFAATVAEERRFAFLHHVAQIVEETDVVSPGAFLPFVTEDTSHRIVATAVTDYVSLSGIADGDPMSRVKDIIGMLDNARLRNAGAAFGGLLHIGDPRVCRLLWPLRNSLDSDALQEANHCATAQIHAATTEFYLDWMEELAEDDPGRIFGLVALGLGFIRKHGRSDDVFMGARPFPVWSVSGEEWRAMAMPIGIAQYIERIAPRMYALERAEPPPRVMPLVLTTWGLEPRTDPSEFLDDAGSETTPEAPTTSR